MHDELYDLDAAAAEVTKEPFGFTYKGTGWSLTHMADIDWRIVESADTGDIAAVREALHAGLGCFHPASTSEAVEHSDQAKAFDRLPQPISVMTDLFGRWMKHAGLRAGESSASSDSSESTAGPSNRASRRATKSTTAKSSRAR